MVTNTKIQYTSVRTRVVAGQVLIGLKHTVKDAPSAQVKTEWIETPPEDAATLAKTIQRALHELSGEEL